MGHLFYPVPVSGAEESPESAGKRVKPTHENVEKGVRTWGRRPHEYGGIREPCP